MRIVENKSKLVILFSFMVNNGQVLTSLHKDRSAPFRLSRTWVFRMMLFVCLHTACSVVPYESAWNSRASRSTNRQ